MRKSLTDFSYAIDVLRLMVDDPEAAHELEDDIRHEALQAIAASSGPEAVLARLVLTTSDIEFPWWTS